MTTSAQSCGKTGIPMKIYPKVQEKDETKSTNQSQTIETNESTAIETERLD